jgi:hypothetical protein
MARNFSSVVLQSMFAFCAAFIIILLALAAVQQIFWNPYAHAFEFNEKGLGFSIDCNPDIPDKNLLRLSANVTFENVTFSSSSFIEPVLHAKVFYANSHANVRYILYYVAITNTNTNKTVLDKFFESPAGPLPLQMENDREGNHGQGSNNGSHSNEPIFIPNNPNPRFSALLTEANGTIVVLDSQLLDRNATYVACTSSS